jgi:hypothetical protein
MHGVGNVIQINPNWNPTYSYSTLPAGYNPNSIPPHWTKLLNRVTPESKGIPKIQNVTVYNVKATEAKKAINAIGFKATILKNFNLVNIDVQGATAGTIDYAENWTFKNVVINTADKTKPEVTNSVGVKL